MIYITLTRERLFKNTVMKKIPKNSAFMRPRMRSFLWSKDFIKSMAGPFHQYNVNTYLNFCISILSDFQNIGLKSCSKWYLVTDKVYQCKIYIELPVDESWIPQPCLQTVTPCRTNYSYSWSDKQSSQDKTRRSLYYWKQWYFSSAKLSRKGKWLEFQIMQCKKWQKRNYEFCVFSR